jgi:hypothetical protein
MSPGMRKFRKFVLQIREEEKNYQRKPLESLKFSILTLILTASKPQPN